MLDARSVGHILKNFGRVAAVGDQSTVGQATRLLRQSNVGCLLVENDQGAIIGILTERDVIMKALDLSSDLESIRVCQIMTRNIISCTLATPMIEAQELMARHGIRHLPVLEDGRPIGMVSSRDVVSHQLSANRAMQRAAEQVATLSKSFQSLDYNEILSLVTREVPRIFGAECGVLALADAGNDFREPHVVSRNLCRCSDSCLKQMARSEGAPIVFYDVPPACAAAGAKAPAAVFHMPIYDINHDADGLKIDQEAYLCMCCFTQVGENEKDLLSYKATLLREILGVNLMNARLYERARRESQIDSLTEVNNRRVFEQHLEHEYERCCRYQHSFCIAIVDVDKFKLVNDLYGHAAGDQVLRDLAGVLRRGLRKTDTIARYGGDEFVLLMPETPLATAVAVLDRVRGWAGSEISRDAMPVTISCGVAQWSGDLTDSATDVLRRADAALYRAKRAGRNRITAAPEHLAKA